MSVKCTGELGAMAIKNDAKVEENMTCHLKINMRNLMNFDLTTRKSQNFSLYWASFKQSI